MTATRFGRGLIYGGRCAEFTDGFEAGKQQTEVQHPAL